MKTMRMRKWIVFGVAAIVACVANTDYAEAEEAIGSEQVQTDVQVEIVVEDNALVDTGISSDVATETQNGFEHEDSENAENTESAQLVEESVVAEESVAQEASVEALVADTAVTGYKDTYYAHMKAGEASSTTLLVGDATLNLSMDEQQIDYVVNAYRGIVTGVVLACGPIDSGSPTILPLFESSAGVAASGVVASGSIREENIWDWAEHCNPVINTVSHIAQSIREGKVYVIVTTAGYPGGEVGGQVGMTPIPPYDTTEPTPNAAPVITLNGSTTVSLIIGSEYVELGAIATDSEDGDLTSQIVIAGTVATTTEGTYTLTYSVADSDGATASATRTVIVGTSTPLTEVEEDADTDNDSGRRSSRRSSSSTRLSAPSGRVLGAASASCSAYLTGYIKPGTANDIYNTTLLQIFLNTHMDVGLTLTGRYDAATINAVNEFQLKYSDEVLKPWVEFGLESDKTPTGYVYKTTSRMINNIACGTNLPMPNLP